MASSQLISLSNALSVSSLLTIEKGAFQRESCCASALSGESIKAKRLYLIYNRGSRFHQIVGPYASLFLAKGQDRCDKLWQKPTFLIIKQWNIRVNNYICSCALLFDNVHRDPDRMNSVSSYIEKHPVSIMKEASQKLKESINIIDR